MSSQQEPSEPPIEALMQQIPPNHLESLVKYYYESGTSQEIAIPIQFLEKERGLTSEQINKVLFHISTSPHLQTNEFFLATEKELPEF